MVVVIPRGGLGDPCCLRSGHAAVIFQDRGAFLYQLVEVRLVGAVWLVGGAEVRQEFGLVGSQVGREFRYRLGRSIEVKRPGCGSGDGHVRSFSAVQ